MLDTPHEALHWALILMPKEWAMLWVNN